jgi:hypothetical protein
MKKGKGFITAGMLALIFSMASCGPKANPAKDFRRKANDQGGITITGYVGQSQTVVIPGKLDGKAVTEIGKEAFASGDSHPRLTSVTIPNSVTTIWQWAFYDNLLTSVTIPDSVTSIGYQAFSKNKLTSVTIPNSVTYLSGFSDNQLTSVTIGNSVTNIGESAFSGNQLTSVTIPDSVTGIDNKVFYDNQLTSVIIPNSVTRIGESAFSSNQLISITIPAIPNTWIGGDPFGSTSFESLYRGNGGQAGTYTRPSTDSTEWTRK